MALRLLSSNHPKTATTDGEVIPKGTYQCKVIPVIQEYDEPIRIKISTRPGYSWKLNSIMLNIVRAY